MITLRMTADVQDDRRVVLTLPPEVPTGSAELVVTVESPKGKPPQPRGVPAEEIRGIAAGNGPPPDDETVKQWIHERRMEKHG
jgi:hypothetical protein